MLAVGELVDHDHLDVSQGKPLLGLLAAVTAAQHELDDFAGVEVAAGEFGVGGVFFQGGDGEVVGFHEGVGDGCDALEVVFCEGGGGAWEGLDEELFFGGFGSG